MTRARDLCLAIGQYSVGKPINYGGKLHKARLQTIDCQGEHSNLKVTSERYRELTLYTRGIGKVGMTMCMLGYEIGYCYFEVNKMQVYDLRNILLQ